MQKFQIGEVCMLNVEGYDNLDYCIVMITAYRPSFSYCYSVDKFIYQLREDQLIKINKTMEYLYE